MNAFSDAGPEPSARTAEGGRWREAGSLRRGVEAPVGPGSHGPPARAAPLVDPATEGAAVPFEEVDVSFMVHEFDLGIDRPVNGPKDVRAEEVENLDEGEPAELEWLRGERDDDETDLDLDGR
jgi:hypothetical protein